MCGRFAQGTDVMRLAKEFKVMEVPEVEARYNIMLTQDILDIHQMDMIMSKECLDWCEAH